MSDLITLNEEIHEVHRVLEGKSEIDDNQNNKGPLWCDNRSSILCAKKESIGEIRTINNPTCIVVEEDILHNPTSVAIGSRKLQIDFIEDMWDVVDEWWRPSMIARRYYKVIFREGSILTIFRDLISGIWWEQKA